LDGTSTEELVDLGLRGSLVGEDSTFTSVTTFDAEVGVSAVCAGGATFPPQAISSINAGSSSKGMSLSFMIVRNIVPD
jgi:hypothetical protein